MQRYLRPIVFCSIFPLYAFSTDIHLDNVPCQNSDIESNFYASKGCGNLRTLTGPTGPRGLSGPTGPTGATGAGSGLNSLVFNAKNMISDGGKLQIDMIPLAVSPPIDGPFESWPITDPAGYPPPGNIGMAFNVPHDWVATPNQTLLIVHFLTPIGLSGAVTGDVNIQLVTTFSPVANGIPNPTLGVPDATQMQSKEITVYLATTAAVPYIHYEVIFVLDESMISPNDFGYFTLTRIDPVYGPEFSPSILLTSVEFRYPSAP